MTHSIRRFNPAIDAPRIEALLSHVSDQTLSADELYERTHVTMRKGYAPVESSAEKDGMIVGYGALRQPLFWPYGERTLRIYVHDSYRNQGIGSALFQVLLMEADRRAVKVLHTSVKDTAEYALQFAQRRGFQIKHHLHDYILDLETFDAARFQSISEKAAQNGIRIASLAELGDTPENRRKLYEVNRVVSLANPSSQGIFPDWEDYDRILSPLSPWYRPDTQFIALENDNFIGIGPLGYLKEENAFIHTITGVLPEHRGRGIAQVLKRHAIQYAQSLGAKYLLTDNDSTNAPMLAINRKFGYQPHDGCYMLVKSL